MGENGIVGDDCVRSVSGGVPRAFPCGGPYAHLWQAAVPFARTLRRGGFRANPRHAIAPRARATSLSPESPRDRCGFTPCTWMTPHGAFPRVTMLAFAHQMHNALTQCQLYQYTTAAGRSCWACSFDWLFLTLCCGLLRFAMGRRCHRSSPWIATAAACHGSLCLVMFNMALLPLALILLRRSRCMRRLRFLKTDESRNFGQHYKLAGGMGGKIDDRRVSLVF